jgi:hypothetical protein
MGSSKDGKNDKKNPTSTTENMRTDLPPAELDAIIEQHHLEAQRKRSESQREAANKLQALTLQQQEQIRRLQEHAKYDLLRRNTGCRPSLPSGMATSNTPTNLKFDSSSVFVATFNPPPHNPKEPPKQHLPESNKPSEMKKTARNGNLQPQMPNSRVANIHDAVKTATNSSIHPITPSVENNFAQTRAFIPPALKKDANMPQANLLPFLGAETEAPPLEFAADPPTCDDNSSNSQVSHSPEIIDLTDGCTEGSNEPPKKKGKTTSVEVTVIVKMPGLGQPSVKTVRSMVESTGSDDDSAK